MVHWFVLTFDGHAEGRTDKLMHEHGLVLDDVDETDESNALLRLFNVSKRFVQKHEVLVGELLELSVAARDHLHQHFEI